MDNLDSAPLDFALAEQDGWRVEVLTNETHEHGATLLDREEVGEAVRLLLDGEERPRYIPTWMVFNLYREES